jgi:hypothetical protein
MLPLDGASTGSRAFARRTLPRRQDYLKHRKVHVDPILAVAMLALARKVIVMNVKDYELE